MYYSYYGLEQSLLRRTKIALLVVAALPILPSITGCATRPTQASALPPAPVVIAPSAEDKAADAKIAYYAKMQQKVEAQAIKRSEQEAAKTAQAEKRGVVVGGSGNVIHSEQSGQSDYANDILKGTPDQIAAGKRYDDAVNDAEAANSFLESRDEAGVEMGAHMFGWNEVEVMRENISRMKNDLDIMQQNFSSMSLSNQVSADPSIGGIPSGPISGVSAKDMIQQDIDKWQTAVDSNQR